MATVVVGVDGSENAQAALEWALGEARRRGGLLRVVHPWDVLVGATGTRLAREAPCPLTIVPHPAW